MKKNGVKLTLLRGNSVKVTIQKKNEIPILLLRLGQFTYRLFFTYTFLILRNLILDPMITNLHNNLSLSYSFLLVADWCLSSNRCYLPLWGSQHVRIRQKWRVFTTRNKPGHLAFRNEFCGTLEHSSVKSIKPKRWDP
jgi:hypothetical protein